MDRGAWRAAVHEVTERGPAREYPPAVIHVSETLEIISGTFFQMTRGKEDGPIWGREVFDYKHQGHSVTELFSWMDTSSFQLKQSWNNCNWMPNYQGFPGGSVVNNLPATQELQERQVWSLGWEDPLQKWMATHSGILAWRIPGRLQSALEVWILNHWTIREVPTLLYTI